MLNELAIAKAWHTAGDTVPRAGVTQWFAKTSELYSVE